MQKNQNIFKSFKIFGLNCPKLSFLTLIIALSGLICTQSGCQLFSSAFIILHGTDEPAACKVKLKGKVAVVCWTDPSLTYTDSDNASAVGASLSRKIAAKLGKKNKITMISQQEVNNRLDNYPDNITGSEDLIAIAKDLEADYVIGVYLMEFEHQEGIDTYKGKATYAVSLIDGNEGQEVYSNDPSERYVYPPNRSIGADQTTGNQFKKEYISRLAEHIGWNFYPHDRYDVDI